MPSIRTISVSGSIPSITQLALGDLAVNTYDGKAYIKKQQGNTQTVIEIGSGSAGTGGGGVTQIIAGTNITISPIGGTGIVTVNANNPVSASYALSSSYAANGGVTQLLAGANISLSPTNGLGQVTVSATLSGSTIFNTSTGSYGSFYDTTTQTNPVGNVPRSMSLNTTDITNGVSISGSTSPFNTYIKTQNAGVYNIQFSAQLDKTDSGTDEIVIWLRKNGINLTDTATTVTLVGNNAKNVAAWNWFVNSAANDYYQIIWQSPDTNVRLFAEPTDGHPGIPSVIVTANRVDQFLSNTGSFSGSFVGSFSGTSSYATDFSKVGLITTGSFGTTQIISGSLTLGNTTSTTNDNITITGTSAGGGVAFISASKFLKIGATLDLTLESPSGIYTNAPYVLVGDSTGGTTDVEIYGSTAITAQTPLFTVNADSTVMNGALEVTGGITGSLQGTATFATDHATKVSTLFVQGYLTGNQSIPNNADTVINFERQYDPNLWLDLGTRRFTPTVAGYYSVSFGAWLENPASPTNQVNVQVRKSTGGGPTGTVMILQQPLNNGTGISLAGTRIFYMDGGTDYLDFTIFQGSGGAKNLLYGGTADGAGTWFSAYLLTM